MGAVETVKRRWPMCTRSIRTLPAGNSEVQCWILRNVPVQPIAEAFLDSRWWESQTYHVEKLAKAIKRHGLRYPPVFGPDGLEGYHRIGVALKLGWKEIPGYIARPVSVLDALFDVDRLDVPKMRKGV